jgi:hypothetical protein
MKKEFDENEEKHLNHKFYQDAEAYREKIRIGQIIKGAHKYPEPFTTASWTNEEIITHIMQEQVDGSHYVYAAFERLQVLQNDLNEAEEKNKWLNKQLLEEKETIREIKLKSTFQRYEKLEKENLAMAQEIEKLKDDKDLYQKLFVKKQLEE